MLKRCKDALKVACALALVISLSPAAADARPQDSEQQNSDSSSVAQATAQDATVETEVDSSKLQETDVSKLAKVSEDAADTVKDYIADRADEVSEGEAASDDESLDLSKKVAKTSETRADGFQQMQEDANIQITDAKTTVSVSKVTKSGSKVKVEAYEQTVFYYDDLSDGVGGSDVAIFGTDHTLTVDTSGDGATIKVDAYDESDLTGIDTTGQGGASSGGSADAEASGSASGAAEATATATAQESSFDSVASLLSSISSLLSPQQAYAASSVKYDSNYSPEKAIAYADKYWTEYNTKYRNFNPVGGDCANFVSQCMKAGKLNQKKSGSSMWYYKSGTDYSESWTYCPTMVQALKSRGKYYWISKEKLSTKAAAKKIYPGSPVIYNSADDESATGSYYHAVICTGYNSAGTPVISAHNNDRYHVPFTYAGNACATIQLTATAAGATYSTTVTTVVAQGIVEKNKLEWRLEDGNVAVITGCTGAGTSVTIPATVSENGKTYAVTGIADDAFSGKTSLKKVVIGSSVTTVGARAFKGCTKLAEIEGLDHVTTLGAYAFSGCAKLKSAALSAQLTVLPKYLFQGCKKLATVTGTEGVAKVGSHAFDGCKKLASLPDFSQVATVGSYAFKNCDALVKAAGFKSLSTLGKGAFYGCDSLKRVNLKSTTLKSIGSYSFWKTKKLSYLRSASTELAKIGQWAFFSDDKLTTIKLKTTLLNVDNVGYSSFTLTASKPTVYVPKGKKKAYKAAFVKHGLSSAAKFKNY